MREIRAASGRTPYDSLMTGLELSRPLCWVMADRATDNPFLMGGVRLLDADTRVALAWFLATPEIARHAKAVHRTAKAGLRSLFEVIGCNALGNAVDARNHAAVRWLYCLGFSFPERNGTPAGVNGEPFRLFHMTRERFNHIPAEKGHGRCLLPLRRWRVL